MKKILALIAVGCVFAAAAQNTTVTYTASTENIANPERGFYQHEGTSASSYDPLSQSSLTSYRVNNKQTLILRLFYLDTFKTSPISSTYLAAMRIRMIRTAGSRTPANRKCLRTLNN